MRAQHKQMKSWTEVSGKKKTRETKQINEKDCALPAQLAAGATCAKNDARESKNSGDKKTTHTETATE